MTIEVMLDLETLGNKPTAPILQIGVVAWNTETGKIEETFIANTSLEDELKSGFKPSGSTFLWWLEQSEEARLSLIKGQIKSKPTSEVLKELKSWFFNKKLEDCKVWSNGPAFDSAILATHFQRFNADLPWKFWNDRCFRTLMDELKFNPKSVDRVGVYHNAVDDCLHQIRCIQLARKKPFAT
jgi:hypothetical protein